MTTGTTRRNEVSKRRLTLTGDAQGDERPRPPRRAEPFAVSDRFRGRALHTRATAYDSAEGALVIMANGFVAAGHHVVMRTSDLTQTHPVFAEL